MIVLAVASHTCSKALQVWPGTADKRYMTLAYQLMSPEERVAHHDELRDEGYEWCPECGETLVWDLPKPCPRSLSAGEAPIVTGDCPPITADQLATTALPIS